MIFQTENIDGTITLPENAPKGKVVIDIKKATEKQLRTNAQNKAMREYCIQLSEEMDHKNIERKVIVEIRHDQWGKGVKLGLWNPIMMAVTGKDSSANLTHFELQNVYEECNKFTKEKWGIDIPFPSEEELRLSIYGKKV